MNIFFIPSWYPSNKNPNSGIFIQEQAKFIGKYSKNDLVIINLWGDQSTKLNFEKPIDALANLFNYFSNKPYQKKISPRVWEFNQPVLEWSARFFRGNINSIIKASEKNFLKAQERFGKINIIHAHVSFPAGFVAMKLAQKYHLPYIITEHMGPFPLPPFDKNKNLFKLLIEPLKKANQVIGVSRVLQKELLKYHIRSLVIPNLVDENFFILKKSKTSQFNFFTLVEIRPEKGIEDLLKAIPDVVRNKKNVIFRIGGVGPYLQNFKNLAKKLNISKKIIWLGFLSREEVRQEMQKCRAFILPSYHESFGLVLVEALFSGKPVISTRCGGPEDIITKDNGILVEIGNPRELARAILRIIENVSYYNAHQIRKSSLERFSTEAVVYQIRNVYNKVLKESK